MTASSGSAGPGGPIGLRERKKDATRRSLAETGLRLVRERGYDEVTIADLVEAVGISRRTFSNYFASKAECVVAVCDGLLDDILESIRIQPAGATTDQLLEAAVLEMTRQHENVGATLGELVEQNPELRAQVLVWDQTAVAPIAAAIAERLDLDREDIRVIVIAQFAITAGRTTIERWSAAGQPGGQAGFASELHRAFSVLNLNALTDRQR